MNCVEKHIQERIQAYYPDRKAIIGRCAHLTDPQEIHAQQGRGKCQARTLCERGCPFGAYFSSNSSTLPWAARTGNLNLRPHSVVHSIIYDETLGKAKGVRVIDALTKEVFEYYARIIFVNAACINSNLIMLNSTSNRFPNGLGNDSGVLGHYIAFHNYRGDVSATFEGFEDQYYYGRRPTQVFVPAYRNIFKQDTDYLRSFMSYYGASRIGWSKHSDHIGAELKEDLQKPGAWHVGFGIQGETIPVFQNHVRLSADKRDDWDIPQVVISVGYSENDEKMSRDFLVQAAEMLDKAGCKNIVTNDNKQAPGLDIHEMGGCRMGKNPKTSILNQWNQIHTCKNVFVTDGACMTSVGNQNPSLTFMALTARAANYAVEEARRGNL
jgi:choline dehydrogenase-like flavoprotein